MAGKFELEKRVARFALKFAVGAVPRPPHWSGYRIRPDRIEFSGAVLMGFLEVVSPEREVTVSEDFAYVHRGDGWYLELSLVPPGAADYPGWSFRCFEHEPGGILVEVRPPWPAALTPVYVDFILPEATSPCSEIVKKVSKSLEELERISLEAVSWEQVQDVQRQILSGEPLDLDLRRALAAALRVAWELNMES